MSVHNMFLNALKGDLSCKMHFGTSCLHEYVSPVFQGTHQVSENTTLSIFLHTQISKKGAATDLIKTDPDLNTLLTSGKWRYGYWANSTNQEETATAIAVRKRWRRCSTNLVSPECVTPPRLLNTAVRGGVTNFVTFTCLHHANNPNVK